MGLEDFDYLKKRLNQEDAPFFEELKAYCLTKFNLILIIISKKNTQVLELQP
jgi:hypothetical protein